MKNNIWVITEYSDYKNVIHQWFFVDKIAAKSKFELLKFDYDSSDSPSRRPGRFLALSGPHESGTKIDSIYGDREVDTWTIVPYTNTQAI